MAAPCRPECINMLEPAVHRIAAMGRSYGMVPLSLVITATGRTYIPQFQP